MTPRSSRIEAKRWIERPRGAVTTQEKVRPMNGCGNCRPSRRLTLLPDSRKLGNAPDVTLPCLPQCSELGGRLVYPPGQLDDHVWFQSSRCRGRLAGRPRPNKVIWCCDHLEFEIKLAAQAEPEVAVRPAHPPFPDKLFALNKEASSAAVGALARK